MAAHHHHYYHHHNNSLPPPPPPPPPCCSYSCCSASPPTLPPYAPPSAADPLLQIVATHLLQSQPPSREYFRAKQHLVPKEEVSRSSKQTRDLLQSLVRRVAALETSLRRLSSSSSSSLSSPRAPHFSSAAASSFSLRDVAARIIQIHFRAFLARRSKTLRHLRQLASIKSSLAALKSSLSDKTHFRPDVLSRKATDLLSELESIQGGDSMIREGKKSIGAELVHFLEFVDGLSVRRRQVSSKPVKKVSFAEYANESRVFARSQEQPEDEDEEEEEEEEEEVAKHCQVTSEQQRVFLQKSSAKENKIHPFYSEAYLNEDEAQVEMEAFHQLGDEEKNASTSLSGGGYSGLAAPLPVQMEPRADDLMKKKKKKIVRIV